MTFEILLNFKQSLQKFSEAFQDALIDDLGRHSFQTTIAELSLVILEIEHFLDHGNTYKSKQWSLPDILNMPSISYTTYEPLGNILIIGSYNYPIVTTLVPLVGALFAGNTVTLKPSEKCVSTCRVLKSFCDATFDRDLVKVEVTSTVQQAQAIVDQDIWDKIMFTGSEGVGKQIAITGAKHLTPVLLELGGEMSLYCESRYESRCRGKTYNMGCF